MKTLEINNKHYINAKVVTLATDNESLVFLKGSDYVDSIFGFIEGYSECQKDMADNSYTTEDIKKAFEYGKSLEPFDCFDDFIESLKKIRIWKK